MPMKKIAISLPEPVLKTVDRLAARRGESRSRTIATILSRVARAKRDRDLTAQIDALFADETIIPEQKRTADEFLRMTSWPKVENAFVLLERKCLSQILSATRSRRSQPHIRTMKAGSRATFQRKRWPESMRFNSEWLQCDDGIIRPVIRLDR